MRITVSQSGEVTVVEPQGQIDSDNAKAFTKRLSELVEGGTTRMVVDLRQVNYISSAGFRSLLVVGKSLDEHSGKLVLCALSAEIRRLFEIGSFDELFVICPTQDEGIAKAA
jgi:anti-sigma B factor antagonist